jgi:hypothetical protein
LGVHRDGPNSGWLLSYGLKRISAAMVVEVARFLTARKKNEFAQSSWHRVEINTTDKNDEHYQKYHFLLILREKTRS